MRDIRLIAMDMDGTLLNGAHETTSYTRDVLRRAASAGIALALCTGRCLSELKEHLENLPMVRYVVAENGGCLYDVKARRIVRQIALAPETTEAALCALQSYDVILQAFLRNQSYMQCRSDQDLTPWHIQDFLPVFRSGSVFVDDLAARCLAEPGAVEKINAYFTSDQEKERFRRESDGFAARRMDSIGVGFELSPLEASKGAGLNALCAHLGISPANAMAIGDGDNDVDMMRAAGIAVAMGNAIGAVKRLSAAVTDDCDHDGAAKAIERLALGEAL